MAACIICKLAYDQNSISPKFANLGYRFSFSFIMFCSSVILMLYGVYWNYFLPAFMRPSGSKRHPSGCRAIAALIEDSKSA